MQILKVGFPYSKFLINFLDLARSRADFELLLGRALPMAIFTRSALNGIFVAGFATGIGLMAASLPAQAGIFNIPHFVTPGEYAVGIEPEFVTTGSAAIGVNLRY